MNPFWSNSNVMITGVSGTLGSALSKELLSPEYGIRRLAGIARKGQPVEALQRSLDDSRFRPLIGDIRDIDRLRIAFRRIDYIFHAAAFKSVNLGEYNPGEILSINGDGTKNVLQVALECGVKKVIFISSDKATLPVSTYGKSKALGESLVVAWNSYGGADGTRYACARYGNVCGSAGSVIPLFLQQRESGKLTVTHQKMTRFWMTIQQACKFVIRCMERMQGGEIFVPRLPSAPVMQIASAIAPDAQIEIVGIRPGEKMHELMISPEESRRARDMGWAYRITPEFNSWGASYTGGSPVPDGWAYSSASAERLTDRELKGLLI